MSAVMHDSDGQIVEAHSVSAGLDYPASGPEHAQLRDSGRARYVAVGDDEAVAAFRRLCRLEGIIPALEPSHAVAWLLGAGIEAVAGAERNGGAGGQGLDLLTLSGRGDKDLAEVIGLD